MDGDPANPQEPDDPADQPDEVTEEQRTSRARIDRARLARIFGDVLPETTRDERGESDAGVGDSDEWLRRQVPPHYSG
ncbi:hypothetical protein NWP13_09900 [Rhodococcus pyridinivorans]|nr:hypothetical protein [Rhodococcus pyridinivorans]